MIEFFRLLGDVIWRAWTLDPALLQAAQTAPPGQASVLVVTVAILAGASQLMGQSVVLFINRVSPRRFMLSLLLYGFVFGISLLGWALTTWLVGLLFGRSEPLWLVGRMVLLGSAPYILGALVLVPYAGPLIGRIIAVWSFIVTLGMLQFTYQTTWLQALLMVGTGWLLLVALTATIGRPVVALRNWFFRTTVGASLDTSTSDILAAFAAQYAQHTAHDAAAGTTRSEQEHQ
jgi:hypothetical protein